MKRLLLFTALIVWSSMASAVVYKWVDAQGKVQYGDRPPDGVHAEIVELLVAHSNSTSARATSASSQPAPGIKSAAEKPSPKDANDKKVIDQDVAQAKDKECTDARDRYTKLIEGRHIYKTGPDGERQFMTSEEIDTERLNAKRDVDSICNSQS